VGRSACDADGERKTSAVCSCHDLGPLPALRFPDAGPPFFAPLKEASTKPSFRSNPPRSLRSIASARSTVRKVPFSLQRWNQRWHVWYGGYFEGISFHCAPVRSTQRMPFQTARGSFGGRPGRSGRFNFRGGSFDAMTVHCSSVRSIRIVDHDRDPPSIPHPESDRTSTAWLTQFRDHL
jgi:hypothetical protein